MSELDKMKRELLLPEYQEKFDKLVDIALELNSMGYFDLEMKVLRKLSGLKMMIDGCK